MGRTTVIIIVVSEATHTFSYFSIRDFLILSFFVHRRTCTNTTVANYNISQKINRGISGNYRAGALPPPPPSEGGGRRSENRGSATVRTFDLIYIVSVSAYLLYNFVLFVDGHKDTVDNDDKHDE